MADSRPVTLPHHLWEALDLMEQEMGLGRDALVAQAVFMLSRLNGYVIPGKVATYGVGGPPVVKANTGARSKAARRAEPEQEPLPGALDDPEGNPFEEGPRDEGQSEPESEPEPEPPPPAPAPAPAHQAPSRGAKVVLTLMVAGREPHKMVGDALIIGRGKSCEFVIESNRVSREHCRVTREGPDFVIEDLNSSNGTFYGPNKDKITRRKIKDGDEFTLGTEKIRFQIRR